VALVDPAGHAYPAAQGPVQDARIWLEVFPYWPAGHGAVQLVEVKPSVEPNVPTGQLGQNEAPAREYLPAGHRLLKGDVDPDGQAYPALQGPEQAAEPTAGESPNWPAGQGVHDDDPARLYCPAAQGPVVGEVDPAGQVYPAAHGPVHWLLLAASCPYLTVRTHKHTRTHAHTHTRTHAHSHT
jgi:hypothetical protein